MLYDVNYKIYIILQKFGCMMLIIKIWMYDVDYKNLGV